MLLWARNKKDNNSIKTLLLSKKLLTKAGLHLDFNLQLRKLKEFLQRGTIVAYIQSMILKVQLLVIWHLLLPLQWSPRQKAKSLSSNLQSACPQPTLPPEPQPPPQPQTAPSPPQLPSTTRATQRTRQVPISLKASKTNNHRLCTSTHSNKLKSKKRRSSQI